MCLFQMVSLISLFSSDAWAKLTYAEPPWAFPNMALFLPRLVKSWMPSIQKPALTTKPVRYSPRRTSIPFMSA